MKTLDDILEFCLERLSICRLEGILIDDNITEYTKCNVNITWWWNIEWPINIELSKIISIEVNEWIMKMKWKTTYM